MLACSANVWNLKKKLKNTSSVLSLLVAPLLFIFVQCHSNFFKKGKILNFIYVKLRLVVSTIKNEKMGAFRNGGHQGYTNNSSQSESRSYLLYTTAHKEKSSFLQQRNLGTQTHSRCSTENELKGVLFCFLLFKGFSFFFSFPLTMFCLGIFSLSNLLLMY